MLLALVMWVHQAHWHATPPAPVPVETPAPAHNPGDYHAIAADHAVPLGWVYAQFHCLDVLWQRESGWDPHAHNLSGAGGIPQLMRPTHAERLTADQQIDLGVRYIAERYGAPCAALAHSNATGWY